MSVLTYELCLYTKTSLIINVIYCYTDFLCIIEVLVFMKFK